MEEPGMRPRTMQRDEHEQHKEGQVLPALLVLVVALLAVGLAFFQVGRASDLRARAQTAADGAALAAARQIADDLVAALKAVGPLPQDQIGPQQITGKLPQRGPCQGADRQAAEHYAQLNGGEVVKCERSTQGALESDVLVAVDSAEKLSGSIARRLGVEGKKAHAQARARVSIDALPLPTTTSIPPTSIPPTSMPPTSIPPTSIPPPPALLDPLQFFGFHVHLVALDGRG
jgi:hypothetical protein